MGFLLGVVVVCVIAGAVIGDVVYAAINALTGGRLHDLVGLRLLSMLLSLAGMVTIGYMVAGTGQDRYYRSVRTRRRRVLRGHSSPGFRRGVWPLRQAAMNRTAPGVV